MPILLQINSVINSGSTGRIAEEIGQLAITNGWESYIAYGRNDQSSHSHKIKIGSAQDIYLHVLKTRFFDRHGFGSKRSTVNLIERIKKIKPDIIHLHNIHGYYINIEILFNYLAVANIPVIWTLHDCWAFTGHCAYFDYIGCDKWKTYCFDCPQKGGYPSSIWRDNSKQNYMMKLRLFNSVNNITIVPVSKWLGNLVKDSFLTAFPRQLIYNGVSITSFFPQPNINDIKDKLSVGSRFMILGVASIWSKRKGFDDFIHLSKLIDEYTVIVLLGLNKKQLKALPKNIIGITRTESITQLAEVYSAADLFLNLTYEDNFPTTNLESLACGTPVLTYDTGGSIESIFSDSGFVVKKGDFEGIMQVANIVKQKGREAYKLACRNRAVNLFNNKNRYKEYIELYEKLLISK